MNKQNSLSIQANKNEEWQPDGEAQAMLCQQENYAQLEFESSESCSENSDKMVLSNGKNINSTKIDSNMGEISTFMQDIVIDNENDLTYHEDQLRSILNLTIRNSVYVQIQKDADRIQHLTIINAICEIEIHQSIISLIIQNSQVTVLHCRHDCLPHMKEIIIYNSIKQEISQVFCEIIKKCVNLEKLSIQNNQILHLDLSELHIPQSLNILVISQITVEQLFLAKNLNLKQLKLNNVRTFDNQILIFQQLIKLRSITNLYISSENIFIYQIVNSILLYLKSFIIREGLDFYLNININQLYAQRGKTTYTLNFSKGQFITSATYLDLITEVTLPKQLLDFIFPKKQAFLLNELFGEFQKLAD
ncbi:hypothetical protein SS50377_22969 [Spironucleus salmonicida]|uniref:Uncharacterized protein n=1 Tax=Spironucleus salmonicida TaxID=348837 RepID=V6LTR5_9EUKA|nr:hypothetical protein SS50377_22969 [Spironucleus salmonicida]|eukprot:EST47985.1 Hypothetical protein SS50377_11900 [Spironucleus salmonicida]